jgi:transcriptional regulator with XRE-family HTH domain
MVNAVRAKLAGDLDELRLLVGLTYRELARRTGCARSTLHDALTGRRFPRLDTVLAIVRACGGDVAGWRERWVAAGRRAPTTAATLLAVQYGRIGQEPGTAPRMSWHATRPS